MADDGTGPRRGAIPRPHAAVPQIEEMADYTEAVNILCHGDSGSGKTVLWADLPDTIVISIEEGTVSAKRQGSNAKVMRVRNWPEYVAAYEFFRDGGTMKIKGKTYHASDFKNILIDSVTSSQTLCIRYIMEMVVLANPNRDPHIPAQGDHFKWQLWMKEMVQDWNSLPQNTIWLARSMVKDDPDGNEIIVPLIEGKDYQISAWVCGEVHLLCYLKKDKKGSKTVRKLYTNDHTMYWCKDRYDSLPHVIEFDKPQGVAGKIMKMIDDSGVPEMSTPSTRTATRKRAAKPTTRKRK